MRKLFIHIPKNAGRTIHRSKEIRSKIVFNKAENIKDENRIGMTKTMKKYNEHVGSGMQHARWCDIKPSITSHHPAFAIIRNPWAKVVSRYTYQQRVVSRRNKKILGKGYESKTFEDFLEERYQWGNIPYYWHRAIRNWYPQKDHVVDEKGNLKCDILRMEFFDDEIVRYLNLKKVPEKRNVSNGTIINNEIVNRKSYKDFYNKKTIQIIADWYKEDIDFFGFDFDTSATKNIWARRV